MQRYLSTYTNKIDKKGRVSIPAAFRAVVTAKGPSTILAFPSIGDHACVDCYDPEQFDALAENVDAFGPYSDDRDAFSTSILADCVPLNFEGDGRFVLPQDLIDYAGLDGEVTFVGQGKYFQIWNPKDYADFRDRARKLARERRERLGSNGNGGAA